MTTLSCSEARELVSDYIDGELPESIAAALEGHLQTCPNCPPLYASLIQTLADLKGLGTAAVGDDIAERVVAALARTDEPGGDADPGAEAKGDDHG